MSTALLEAPGASLIASAESLTVDNSGLGKKLDFLTSQMAAMQEQLTFLAEQAEQTRRNRMEMDDLRADLTPVVKDMYAAAVEQLQEIQTDMQLEDLIFLLKRLARNARTFTDLLDLLESANDLVTDAAPLTRSMMDEATAALATLEQKGYFGFARQGGYVLDKIVTSFSEDDVKLLGDNVVTILATVKQLTQPEIMTMLDGLTRSFTAAEANAANADISYFGLLKQMRDPAVRRGLAVTLDVLKRVAPTTAR